MKIAILAERSENVNENYFNAVARFAEPVEAPVGADPEIVLNADGIVIPGGVDIDPGLYHEKNISSYDIKPELDEYETQIISGATERKIPILGICRGFQMLNVFFGGTLQQNVMHCEIHARDGEKDRVHETDVLKTGFVWEIYQSDRLFVNSAHHQAIDRIGKGLRPVQYSADGVIEAISHETLPVYAVEWHPERMCLKNARTDTADGLEVFRFFGEKCREARSVCSA